jgi:hypothetical protein
MTTKGRIERHYKMFGGITVIFIEVKVILGTADERLDAMAQVIAESAGEHNSSLQHSFFD